MKMREIADAAGVSLTAVSLVLNGKPGIGDEKRALVTRLLQENGYQIRPEDAPQRIHAHSNLCFLKYSKHSYLVNGNPGFVTQIMDAAGEKCRRHGYNLLVNAFSDFSAINRAELIDTATTGGVILLGTEIEREDLSYFDGLQKPFVIVDNALDRLPFSTVTMDNAGAVFEAVEYLRSLGHRKIGFLYNSIPSSNDNARRDAFEAAMHQPGLSYSDDLICRVFPTMDGARKSFGEALDRGIALPTAFLANNDSIALGAMRAMQERGITKIALGHHYDDVIETILMGMLYGSQIQTMMPKLHSTNFPGMELIRPMYLIREADIKTWRDVNGLHFIQCACKFTDSCTTCGNEENRSKRAEIKELIQTLKAKNPEVEAHIFRSVENVNVDTVIAYKKHGKKISFLEEYDHAGPAE